MYRPTIMRTQLCCKEEPFCSQKHFHTSEQIHEQNKFYQFPFDSRPKCMCLYLLFQKLTYPTLIYYLILALKYTPCNASVSKKTNKKYHHIAVN